VINIHAVDGMVLLLIHKRDKGEAEGQSMDDGIWKGVNEEHSAVLTLLESRGTLKGGMIQIGDIWWDETHIDSRVVQLSVF
jgi:hypothetical protein